MSSFVFYFIFTQIANILPAQNLYNEPSISQSSSHAISKI